MKEKSIQINPTIEPITVKFGTTSNTTTENPIKGGNIYPNYSTGSITPTISSNKDDINWDKLGRLRG